MRLSRKDGLLASAFAGLLALALFPGQGEAPQAGPAAPPVPAAAAPASPAAPAGRAVSGHAALVDDQALLNVIHAYLLEQTGPARADALRLHLKQTLAPDAYHQASTLVDHYLDYMAAHDALLAVQRITGSDLRRIAIWCDQRDRLRQRLLGTAVTQAWYRQEDAQLKRIFDEAALGVSATQPPDLLSQTALDQAVKSFAAMAEEGPAWAARQAAYLQAKSQITHNASLDEAERSIRIRELLLRSFSSEADRFRMRSLEND